MTEDRKRVSSRSFEKNSTGESRAPSIDRETTQKQTSSLSPARDATDPIKVRLVEYRFKSEKATQEVADTDGDEKWRTKTELIEL